MLSFLLPPRYRARMALTLTAAIAFSHALVQAGEKLKFFDGDSTSAVPAAPSKSLQESDLSKTPDILERGVRHNSLPSVTPSAPKQIDPAKLQELWRNKTGWMSPGAGRDQGDSAIKAALGVRESAIEKSERSMSDQSLSSFWLQNASAPQAGKFSGLKENDPFGSNDDPASSQFRSPFLGSAQPNRGIPTFKLAPFSSAGENRFTDPFGINNNDAGSSSQKKDQPQKAGMSFIDKLFSSPSASSPEKDPSRQNAFGWINSLTDTTQRPVQPVTGSGYNAGELDRSRAGMNFSGTSGKLNLSGSAILDSIGAKALGDSSLSPAANVPAHFSITPRPPVLEIPRRKF